MLKLGIAPRDYHLLTVIGRNTGKPHSVPVAIIEEDARRWLVAPYGEVDWVRNARISGWVELSRGKSSVEWAIRELSSKESAPVLRMYLQKYPITAPYFDAQVDSPLREFALDGSSRPVFELTNVGTSKTLIPGLSMAKRGFLARHNIVRNAIREDVLYFAIPAVFVLIAGMGISGWDLVRQQGSLYPRSILNIVGLALIAVGLTIELIAQFTLRRFYSSTLVIRENHQLITHGIYRFMRHPIYLGAIMGLIGVPVYVSSLYGLLIMSALIPIFLNRIRMEEKLLTEEFGDAYQTYREATSKLIPFIY